MSSSFREYMINFLLAGLFLTAVISFAVSIADNYGYDEDFVKSEQIDFSGMEQQIDKSNQDAEKWAQAFTSDNALISFGAVVIYAIWGVGKLMWGSIITILDIFLVSLSNVLGIPPIVIGTITAIIMVSLIFYLWRVLKAGE